MPKHILPLWISLYKAAFETRAVRASYVIMCLWQGHTILTALQYSNF